jgi:hypothetical protein
LASRDYTDEQESVHPQLERIGVAQPQGVALPDSVDLRGWYRSIVVVTTLIR